MTRIAAILLSVAVVAEAQSPAMQPAPTQPPIIPPPAPHSAIEQAWKTIVEGSNSTNAAHRKQAIAGLEAAGRVPRAIAIVENALADKDVEVRQTAAAVLGAVKSKKSIAKLKAALEDSAPEVSFEAARALWALGDTSGREILMAVALGDRASSSGLLREQMRDAIKKLHNPAALAMIGVKEGAGAFLGPFGIGIMVFEELRKDGSATARTLSVAALANDTDPRTLEILEDALQDKNWVVRAAAARALGTRHEPASIAKLDPLLLDKHEAVRYMAAGAIIYLDTVSLRAPKPRRTRTQPTAAHRAQALTSTDSTRDRRKSK